LEGIGVEGRIILKEICNKSEGGGHGLIYLAQVMDKKLAVVNTVMNFQVPCNAWNFLTTGGTQLLKMYFARCR
jgi:hypothetical protein